MEHRLQGHPECSRDLNPGQLRLVLSHDAKLDPRQGSRIVVSREQEVDHAPIEALLNPGTLERWVKQNLTIQLIVSI